MKIPICKIDNNLRTQTITLPATHDNGLTNMSCQSVEVWRQQTGEPNWYVVAEITPEFDRTTHQLTDRFDPIAGMLEVEVIPAPTAEQIAANKKALIAAIANAARDAVESEANAALQDQMWSNYKSAAPHAYVVANVNWGKAIYTAAENRKAQVQAGVADDYSLTDFSSFGPKPYTVDQLYLAGVVEL